MRNGGTRARASAFVFVVLLALVFPVSVAFAQGERADSAGALLRPLESAVSPDASAAPNDQALPPSDTESGPGSGPPAGMSGSGLISGLLVAGVVAALVISGLLVSKIYKKDK